MLGDEEIGMSVPAFDASVKEAADALAVKEFFATDGVCAPG